MSITQSIEIARPPEEVFAYIDDLSRHGEWQSQIESSRVETEGPTRVGTRAVETRNVPGGKREFTYEITEHDPPRLAAFTVLNGPVRPHGRLTVEPAASGARYTVDLQMVGHGFGKLLAPLAERQARKQIPKDLAALKDKLEGGTA